MELSNFMSFKSLSTLNTYNITSLLPDKMSLRKVIDHFLYGGKNSCPILKVITSHN